MIEQIAANGSCVIIERRADQILKRNGTSVFGVFITAPKEKPVSRIAVRENQTIGEAERKVWRVDKERAEYYNSLSDDTWGMADAYELCINIGQLDVDEVVEPIVEALNNQCKVVC